MQKIMLLLLLLPYQLLHAQRTKGFRLVDKEQQKQIDVLYNGRLLTAYCWYDSIRKPILFPVNTLNGITVTRGYPISPRAGERTDHPHHTGVWMNYESVNGLDFWNNSTAIPEDKRNQYGTIIHRQILAKQVFKTTASLTAAADWMRPDGQVLLKEKTTYKFSVMDAMLVIDRTTQLTAVDTTVIFKDAKDGFFAIRVARELEMPSKEAAVFFDAQGNKTAVPQINNAGISGLYRSSEGAQGDSVWGSKGKWTLLTGEKEGKRINIVIFDHPENVGFPAYRHARGYGLFAINPLGRKIFSNGKEEMNLTLKPGASVTFTYRMLVQDGKSLSPAVIDKYYQNFIKKG